MWWRSAAIARRMSALLEAREAGGGIGTGGAAGGDASSGARRGGNVAGVDSRARARSGGTEATGLACVDTGRPFSSTRCGPFLRRSEL